MTDSYRPNYSPNANAAPPSMPSSVRGAVFEFKANNPFPRPRGPRKRGTRHRGSGINKRAPAASSRPLLQAIQDTDNRSLLLPDAKNKFRDVDTITDSDESDMSESEEDSELTRPAKRVKLDVVDTPDVSSTSKWSNPDPYTALPPPPEATGKHMDVVSFIRKAKISDDGAQKSTELAENADFISFDVDLDDEDEDNVSLDAPRGPRADRVDHLGKRKRGHEDAESFSPVNRSNDLAPVLRQWTSSRELDSSPWLLSPAESSPAIALHKEIIDFYDWVKPTEYEAEVRADVLKRLSFTLNQIEPGVLKAFGSYAAGLYLPTGDMDIVFLQLGFKPGNLLINGLPPAPSRSLLNKFAKRLRDTRFARADSVNVIPWAKVPIIKFVDQVSGLRVDLSFNNDTGVIASDTVQVWKKQYPAMPIIVSVIKQYLMLRGLNDVATGGLGGFSVICLVTSLLQHLPGAGAPSNLGQILVEFFNLYGNVMDRETVAIRLDPPGYLDKNSYKLLLFNKEKRDRLTIIDPNRPENNISGGSSQIRTIAACFSEAYDVLQESLTTFIDRKSDSDSDSDSFSFLRRLLGGNFLAYETQRKVSKDLYFGLTGKQAPTKESQQPRSSSATNATTTTKANPKNSSSPALPAVSASSSTSTTSKSTNKPIRETQLSDLNPSQRRAFKLKLVRPDLAPRIGKNIAVPTAIKLGGYKDRQEMSKDLDAKYAALQKKQK